MSKKKIVNKKLLKGKFYSVNGHPGMIFRKSDKKNIYYAIVTGTTFCRHMTMLSHPTEKGVLASYVKNRPVVGKRKHFGSKELKGMRFHKDDRQLLRIIKHRNPTKLK